MRETLVSPDLELNRNDKRPLHQQLLEHYQALIERGVLATGSHLPTEMALMARHGVSRGTVRQALRSLSDAGLVRRETKNGTVVTSAVTLSVKRKPRGQIIGVVFPETRDAFCLDIMKGVQAACREAGAHAAFGYSHHSSALEYAEVTRMQQAGFGGVLVLPHDDPALFNELVAAEYPFVYLDQAHAEVPGDFVGVDNVAASFGVTEHLVKLGYGSVVFLHQSTGSAQLPSTVRERYRGYRDALAAHNLPFNPAWLIAAEDEPDYAEFIRRKSRPRAAVCANDATAAKLLDEAARAGVRVPQDLAVVGFDNVPLAEALSLTTVAQPSREIGLQAARLLLGRIGGDASPRQRLLLPTRLVMRGSCGV